MNDQALHNNLTGRAVSCISAGFALLVLLFAAQGPLQDFVRWWVPLVTADFEELPRRARRLALREGVAGETLQFLKLHIFAKSAIFLGVPVLCAYLIVVLNDAARGINRRFNILLALACVVLFGHWIVSLWLRDNSLVYEPGFIDFLFFPLAMLVTLILTRRLFGGFIVGFAVFWIVYLFVKGDLPVWLPVLGGAVDNTVFENFKFVTQAFWVDTGGVFGAPLQIVSRNVLVFIVFGAFMMSCGAGTLLMKLANIATGRLTGGAAQAAIAASAMFGTISGAALSNVVSTGVMTIPVIKRAGFRPAFAGAVEAAASTGGQIVPPVMGVVAFFVAAEIGLDYRYIMVAAITPAILFYFGVFLTVRFEARRHNIGGVPADQIVPLTRAERFQTLVFIVPIGVLTWFLVTQPSIPRAGFYGFLATFVMALVLFPDFRSPRRVLGALVQAGRMAGQIIVIVAMIGLIIGLLNISGFNGRLALVLTQLATGPLFVVLVVVALGAIVLGMGLPPGATYFIIVIALSSGIDTVALAPLTLHLFVVFFAVMSTVTPPVALAAFAAAPIAGANPVQTGFQASRLAIGGFIIPFAFVYHPALIYKLQIVFEWIGGAPVRSAAMIDPATVSWLGYGWVCLAFCTAMWMIASSLAAFETGPLGRGERALRLVAGLLVLVPDAAIAGPACLVCVLLVALHRWRRRATPEWPYDGGKKS